MPIYQDAVKAVMPKIINSMQTNEGVENKIPKDPGESKPVEATPKEPEVPTPPAGEENETAKKAMEANNKALEAAERRIVELKKENEKLKQGGEPSGNSELLEKISAIQADMEVLKQGSIPKEEVEPVLKELQEARKLNTEYAKSLISSKTVGKGESVAVNKDPLEVKPEPKPLATTPEEIAVLQRRGMDKYGKKIK